MKYFFVSDEAGKRHIIVAENEENVINVLSKNNIAHKDLYELKTDTFDTAGFLITGE